MWERVKKIFTYFMVPFNLIAGVFSVYSAATAITDNIFWIVIVVVAVLGLCGSIGIIIDKAYKPLSDKVVGLSEGYTAIAEKYKSESLKLKFDFFNAGYYNKNNLKTFKREILEGCYYLVSDIKNVIQNALGKKVRVCIKMFHEDSNELLFTYCRDEYTIDESIKKEHNQKIDVTKNSDFFDILNGNKDIFIGGDLKKDYRENKYHNTSRDFKYSSTVVVPIRALIYEVGADEDNEKLYYDNIGFLCVDSRHAHLFSSKQAQMCIDLIQATAHFLYMFISQGNEYYELLKDFMEGAYEDVQQKSTK